MPVRLSVHADPPRFTDRASREPSWRLLHRVADARYPDLHLTWTTLFADLREAIDETALRTALETRNLTLIEDALRQAWARTGPPAQQQTLIPLLQETVREAAEALAPRTAAMLGVVEIQFNVQVPEVLATIEQYAGTQIVGIGDSTLTAVRQTLRQAFTEGRSLTQLMHDLESTIGLTPRQAAAAQALQDRLTAQGLPVREVRRQVAEVSARYVRQRVEAIARTESITSSSMGQQAIWEQAEREGLLDASRLRRFVVVTPDDRLCPHCSKIPGLNPDGRGLQEPFDTPYGLLMYPAFHVQCRCAVSARVL